MISDIYLQDIIIYTALQNSNIIVNARGTYNIDILATFIEGIITKIKLYIEESFGPLVTIIYFRSVNKAIGII